MYNSPMGGFKGVPPMHLLFLQRQEHVPPPLFLHIQGSWQCMGTQAPFLFFLKSVCAPYRKFLDEPQPLTAIVQTTYFPGWTLIQTLSYPKLVYLQVAFVFEHEVEQQHTPRKENMFIYFIYLFITFSRNQANPNSANALNLRDASMKCLETDLFKKSSFRHVAGTQSLLRFTFLSFL